MYLCFFQSILSKMIFALFLMFSVLFPQGLSSSFSLNHSSVLRKSNMSPKNTIFNSLSLFFVFLNAF